MARSLDIGAGAAALTLFIGPVVREAPGQSCQPHWSASFVGSEPDGGVQSLVALTDELGPALYVGGWFSSAGGVPASRAARWSGSSWSALGSGIPSNFNSHGVFGCCAAVYSLCGGFPGDPAVHIGGDFITAGGSLLESIARWQGGAWISMAGGVERTGCVDCAFRVYAQTIYDDGSGPALYAAGTFNRAGGVDANRVAKWDGSGWSPLGEGIGGLPSEPGPNWARAVAVFDDGSGPKLFVAGTFTTAGSVATSGIASWDGASWAAVGGGLGQTPGGHIPSANALAVFDDGHGPALYVGGYFELIGGISARNIARWDGAAWTALGAGVGSTPNDQVWTLAGFNDGTGPALFVGGSFDDAGGMPISGLARWRGGQWSDVAGGVTGGAVEALAAYDDGSGPSLMVGGWFTGAGGLPSRYLARWAGCTGCYPNCDASTTPPVLNILDFVCFINRFAAGSTYANCDASTAPPVLNVLDFQCFLNRFAAGCP